MAYSTCPKCDNQSFEMVELNPTDSNYTVMAVQCDDCGAVVGVMNYLNNNAMIEMIAEMIEELAERLGVG